MPSFPILPSLSPIPKHYPDCCLSLSAPLFESVASLVLTQGLSNTDADLTKLVDVLSIGCGSGLFEAYLQSQLQQRATVEGVEVFSAKDTVKYLPEQATYFVSGTWDLCERARDVPVLIFVYPREVSLAKRYLESLLSGYGENDKLRLIFWFGPRADWVDYREVFEEAVSQSSRPRFVLQELGDMELVGYEMAVSMQKQDS